MRHDSDAPVDTARAEPWSGSMPAKRPPTSHLAGDLIRLCRPRQWVKNIFVIAPLLFSRTLFNPSAGVKSLVAFVCFCVWSSAVYCINDALDAEADRRHPRKKNRPVASGRVPASFAYLLSLGLIGLGAAVGRTFLPCAFLFCGVLYLVNSLAYTLVFKYRVIADVIVIAVGFVIRLLAGCAALGVEPSLWIQVCSFSLALLLGFGKRRLEVGNLANGGAFRSVLELYDVPKLNLLLGITSSICITSYMLYTVAPHTVEFHQTDKLIYSVPFVAYGIFRYLFKVQRDDCDGPVEILLYDPIFALNCFAWLGTIVVIIYLAPTTASHQGGFLLI
jgi:decaprenyl-phosphate phosphoribosyltransferase